MTRRDFTAALAGLALLIPAACSQGPEKLPLEVEIVQAVNQGIKQRTGPKPAARPPLTRAALDTVEGPFIEVTLEDGTFAYLRLQFTRSSAQTGEAALWRTEDDATLTMRNGVLIATRGLRNDLLSASALTEGLQPGPAHGGERRYEIRGGDNEVFPLTLACALEDLGEAPVEIVELVHPARHLQERCEGENGSIVNDYWVDSRSGRIWQSRQWAGPGIGYLKIRQLTI